MVSNARHYGQAHTSVAPPPLSAGTRPCGVSTPPPAHEHCSQVAVVQPTTAPTPSHFSRPPLPRGRHIPPPPLSCSLLSHPFKMVGHHVMPPFPPIGTSSSPEPHAAPPSPLLPLVQCQPTKATPTPPELKPHCRHLHAVPPLGEPLYPTMLPGALPLTTSSSRKKSLITGAPSAPRNSTASNP
jgi:hypothetical protein